METGKMNEKQIQIVDAAEHLFAEKGFHGTSVRDIAEKAQVNLAMISYYFGSKDQLLEAMFEYKSNLMATQLEVLVHQSNSEPLEIIYSLIEHYIDKVLQQQPFHKIMVREQVVPSTSRVQELILGMRKRNLEIIHRVVTKGQEEGSFRKEIDFPLLMTTMFGAVNNMVTTQYYYRALSNLEHLSDEEFKQVIREKLYKHLKEIFKSTLTNEA